MKGSILFNKDINIEVDVDSSAEEDARLISAKNLVDGQELGGGGEPFNAIVTIESNWTSDVDLYDLFDGHVPWYIDDNKLTVDQSIVVVSEENTPINVAIFPGMAVQTVIVSPGPGFAIRNVRGDITIGPEEDEVFPVEIRGDGAFEIYDAS